MQAALRSRATCTRTAGLPAIKPLSKWNQNLNKIISNHFVKNNGCQKYIKEFSNLFLIPKIYILPPKRRHTANNTIMISTYSNSNTYTHIIESFKRVKMHHKRVQVFLETCTFIYTSQKFKKFSFFQEIWMAKREDLHKTFVTSCDERSSFPSQWRIYRVSNLGVPKNV